MQRYLVTTGEGMNLAELENRIKEASVTGVPIYVYGEHETTPIEFSLYVHIGRSALKLPTLDKNPTTQKLQSASLLKFSGYITEPDRLAFDAQYHENAEFIDLQIQEQRDRREEDLDFDWVEWTDPRYHHLH